MSSPHTSQPIHSLPIPSVSSQEFPPHDLPDSSAITASLPIFTLIEDSSSSEHFHPKVHYIFADDPFDPISTFSAPQSTTTATATTTTTTTQTNPPERPIVIDLSSDLTSVKAAYSLSPDWQILNVSVSSAPQSLISDEQHIHNTNYNNAFSNSLPRNSSTTSLNTITNVPMGSSPEVNRIPTNTNTNPASPSARPNVTESLMLTIEGTKTPGSSMGEANLKKLEDMGDGGLYELASTFSERMGMIKRIIEFGMAQEAGRNTDGSGNNNIIGAQQRSGDGSFSRVHGLGIGIGTGNSPSSMGTGMPMGGYKMERGESTRSTS